MREALILNVFLFLCILTLIAGCDQNFQPLQENDESPMSIQGYLDASADTQWVRVTPIREQINQPPVKPEMHVTLEHLESGETNVVTDSLFISPDGFNKLNVWTTMDIEPGQTYRLRAERPDGMASSVTVSTPGDFPEPELLDYGDGCRASLQIEGVERLADLQSQWDTRLLFIRREEVIGEERRFFTIPYRKKAVRVAAGSYRLYIDTDIEKNRILNQLSHYQGTEIEIEVISRNIFVASGGPEWDDEIESLNDIVYALPEVGSNVDNGIGYMVGIVSKTIPYETCFEN